jgi:hypothetical protein
MMAANALGIFAEEGGVLIGAPILVALLAFVFYGRGANLRDSRR